MAARGRMKAALLIVVLLMVGVLGRERCTTDQQRKMQVLSCIYLLADLPPKKSPESSLKRVRLPQLDVFRLCRLGSTLGHYIDLVHSLGCVEYVATYKRPNELTLFCSFRGCS